MWEMLQLIVNISIQFFYIAFINPIVPKHSFLKSCSNEKFVHSFEYQLIGKKWLGLQALCKQSRREGNLFVHLRDSFGVIYYENSIWSSGSSVHYWKYVFVRTRNANLFVDTVRLTSYVVVMQDLLVTAMTIFMLR